MGSQRVGHGRATKHTQPFYIPKIYFNLCYTCNMVTSSQGMHARAHLIAPSRSTTRRYLGDVQAVLGSWCSMMWASLVTQMVKNLPAMWETWVWSMGWEDTLEEGMATHTSILAWRIPMDRGAWRTTVLGGGKELDTTEWLSTAQ